MSELQQQTRAKPAKAKAEERGEWKLAVYFVSHQQAQAKPFYFFSTKRQDKLNISEGHYKKMVFGKNWNGKVNWAGLYKNGTLMSVFKREDGVWQNQ